MQYQTSSLSPWSGATACRSIAEAKLWTLREFGGDVPGGRYPMLVVYSTVNRASILDFHPRLSVINQFVQAGFRVYLIDWKTPTRGDVGLAEYADDALADVIDAVQRQTGADVVHLFGYCWGGVFTVIHAALHPERVASLSLLATPIDLETDSLSTVELWAQRLKIDPHKLANREGLVPGDVIRRILTLANPVQLTLAKWYELVDCSSDPKLVRGFFQGQRWAYDTPPIAANLFADIVQNIYQKNELARGTLAIRQTEARLPAITCPVLSVVGDHDSSVSPAGSLRIGELVSTRPSSIYRFRVPTGHLGLCASIKAHTQTWPKVAQLLASM